MAIKGYLLSPEKAERLDALLDDAERPSGGSILPRRRTNQRDGLPLVLENRTGSTIPRYSIVRASPDDDPYEEAGRLILPVAQVDTDFVPEYFVTFGRDLEDQKRCPPQPGPWVRVAYDSGTPAAGDAWGPKPGQYTAAKGYPASFIASGVVDSDNSIMLARYRDVTELVGKFDSDVSKGDTDTMTVWYNNAGTLAATTFEVEALAAGADITADKLCAADWQCGLWLAGCYES